MQLDLIGAVSRPTGTAVVPPQPAAAQAEPITPERARTVMEFAAKGGPLRESALKHLTPAMLAFMDAQGGEMGAFAKTFGRPTMAAAPPPGPTSPARPKPADDVRIAAVMEAAAAIGRRSSPLLVDRLADRLISLLGDGGSRGFFCGIGHALRRGALDPHVLREAIDAGLGPGVKNPAALFTARIGARLGGRRGGK